MTKEELRQKYNECSQELASKKLIQQSMGHINIAFRPMKEIEELYTQVSALDLEIAELQTKQDCYQRLICKLVETETEDAVLSI